MSPKAKAEKEPAQEEAEEVEKVDPYSLPYVEVEPAGMSLLKVRMLEIERDYFEMYRVTAERAELELHACTTIQRCWRGFLLRRNLKRHTAKALFCQRVWRGYLGRLRFKAKLDDHNKKLRMEYFTLMAMCIQRVFRGFLSRKHVHSFYARKRYLQQIAEKNAEMRTILEEEFQASCAAQYQAEEEKAQRRFGATISRMHHLISTASQPGVFNSPYNRMAGGSIEVAGKLVEDHLFDSVRGLWTKDSMRKSAATLLPPITDRPPMTNYGRSGRLKAIQNVASHASPNLTLQASTPYNMVHDETQLEDFVSRIETRTRHERDFMSSVLEPVPMRHKHFQLPALKNDQEYLDGLIRDKLMLREAPDSLSQETLKTHPHVKKPFEVAVTKQEIFQDSLNLINEFHGKTSKTVAPSQQSLAWGSPDVRNTVDRAW